MPKRKTMIFAIEPVPNGFILYERESYSTSNGEILGVAITEEDLGKLVSDCCKKQGPISSDPTASQET